MNQEYNSGNPKKDPHNPSYKIIDITPRRDNSQSDELDYLNQLYSDDTTPMIEKIMACNPFIRYREEPAPRKKSFLEKLLDFFK